ncbi:glycoside hydrolase family 9 protein [Fulvivirga lutimaris]|uniref:glycoside hydrolase family 9 protein n=1 Tax=Fulvivirga lutimaris TaxID=1819566 RepID=UPI0012BBB33D|nr:glycoside hydrolase family 9 protein [Fulvivirga lutimaris]MTI40425.1 glycoside hydrolase [Fulvivirga lutimaris]
MRSLLLLFTIFLSIPTVYAQSSLEINDLDYFEMPGLDVTVFSDIYPDGHQTGVTIIQHGVRVAANGDLRLEISPGQWSPVPKGGKLKVNKGLKTISQRLWYPDSSKNLKGFNPIVYPELAFAYDVKVTALSGSSFKVSVDLDEPIPSEWVGKIGFNMELFPGDLFGKSFIMDDQHGIFANQPNGPISNYHGEPLNDALAIGKKLIIAPETEAQRMTITSKSGSLQLWDGRSNHNNGWFIVRSAVPAGKTTNAVEWIITPHTIPNWQYEPVIQVSQLGYHPDQEKTVVIEQDKMDTTLDQVTVYQLTEDGKKEVKTGKPSNWGHFLRYNYVTYDFSDIITPGMYVITYRNKTSHAFKINDDVYDRHAWQPTLEYFLPVQMCHMRINEKYRVWHGLCHMDDALMAPIDTNHFDGYKQGPSTLTKYKPLSAVSGLNEGGWHDAGDYDLRVESQIGTVWLLALMIEEFGLDYDATLIDNENRVVEIHVPDGKSDALQQIEHGLKSILGGYRALGRLYRGIICSDLRQYVMLGDASAMTDNLSYDATLSEKEIKENRSGKLDDRLVFTEENPGRELYVAAGLAAASRVLKDSNPSLSKECIETALVLYKHASEHKGNLTAKTIALSELILTTNDEQLKKTLTTMKKDVINDIGRSGWAVGHVIDQIENKAFKNDLADAVNAYQAKLKKEALESPFGVPYKPNIWGAGWGLQRFGVEQYFFHKGWPQLASSDFTINALNFVLGVHPGINTSSFASGVGSKSVTVAYGVNRADWSFIPGGVASGTALIRPDLPELKIWPFFWQQTEYVMGGGATNYMFLVLAADSLFKKNP